MNLSIGALECTGIARGIAAADAMVKTARVELFTARTICPGKHLTLLRGDVAAVTAAVAAGRAAAAGTTVDDFIIPSVHPEVFPALLGTVSPAPWQAIGLVETYSAASGIVGGDAAVKAAAVRLIEIRIANGIGGKSVLILTGDVAAVEAAVAAAVAVVAPGGLLVDSVVIPGPHPDLQRFLC